MSRPADLFQHPNDQTAVVRTVSGEIAPDSATLTDANLPPAGAFSASHLESVWIGVEIDGGTSPTATIELLVRDAEAPDGFRWKRLGTTDTGALDGTAYAELRVDGATKIFARVKAVANPTGTTALRVLARPGKTRTNTLVVYR